MSNASRGPYASAGAKLPSVQTSRIADPNIRQAIDALREWVEVRLGSRGDPYERAVTLRDLTKKLTDLKAELTKSTTTAGTASTSSADLSSITNRLTSLEDSLAAFISKANSADDDLQSQIEAVLSGGIVSLDSLLNTPHHFTAAQTTELSMVRPDGAGNVVMDGDQSTIFLVDADQDCTIKEIDGLNNGGQYTLMIRMDATGGWAITFDGAYSFPVAPEINTAPDAVTLIHCTAVQDSSSGAFALEAEIGGASSAAAAAAIATSDALAARAYLLGTTDAALPNALVLTDAGGIGIDLATAYQLKIKVKPVVVTLTWASSLTVDLSTIPHGGTARCVLAGATAITITGGTDGQVVHLELVQDATGGRTVSFASGAAFGTDIPSFTPTATANKADELTGRYHAASSSLRITEVARGF